MSTPVSWARGRRLLAMVCVIVVTATSLGGWAYHRSRHVVEPLRSAAVAIGANGERVILPGDEPKVPLLPGTRVLASAGAAGQVLAAEQRAWLSASTGPTVEPHLADMSDTALLDLHTLLMPDGAAVAGWPQAWRYVWPRDASMVAVALSRTGHADDAADVMEFLQRQMPPDGLFQARYQPDGSGPPDRRGVQTDGTGWVLWAVAQMVRDTGSAAAEQALLTRLRPLVDGSTRAALRLTDGPGAMPPPSQDYWEVRDDRLSLGTAAPLAFGLEAAVDLQARLGDQSQSRAASRRAVQLRASIDDRFGREGYPRFLGTDDLDASVAFLLPPFTTSAAPRVVAAWREAAQKMARPAGGLAPGQGWKNDGISWTPQTALFALTAASIGDRSGSTQRLTWLAGHRTAYGALPEKVLSDGAPSGPAPLAWTDAIVLLALDTLATSP